MKKYIIIIAIIMLFLTTLGFATNPSYEDYKAWYKEQAQAGFKNYKSGEETTEFEKSLMNFFAGVIADTSVVREDYKLYSLYKTNSDEHNYKVLGLFNNFFVIKDEISQNQQVQ